MATVPQKRAPGRVKMKCMIWEPNPISERPAQDYTVVYNSTTLKRMPSEISRLIVAQDSPPYGLRLREKYVYRDTFMRIKNELVSMPFMIAQNGEQLLDSSGNPNYQYVEHQTFSLLGSVFNEYTYTPTEWQQSKDALAEAEMSGEGVTEDELSRGQSQVEAVSKWECKLLPVVTEEDGHYPGDPSNLQDYIDEIKLSVFEPRLTDILKYGNWSGTTMTEDKANKILERRFKAYLPVQIQGTTQGTDCKTGKCVTYPIHWLCEKETDLFSGEDFFVEFHKGSLENDVASIEAPMLPFYSVIDSRTTVSPGASGDGTASLYPTNGGVVELAEDGTATAESRTTYDLNKQPYYLIEIGNGHSEHNYIILLAYNAYPTFLHVGKFNVFQPAREDKNAGVSYPAEVVPVANTSSRRLSVFQDVSCKQLLGRDTLRITVRNHMGNIVITFGGYEGKPWIISRTDLVEKKKSGEDDKIDIKNIQEKPVSMIVPAGKLRIGCGHMKSGFLFGPLHYENIVVLPVLEHISIRGPVEEENISLFLGSRRKSGEFIYQQDAENYFELINGVVRGGIKILDDNRSVATAKSLAQNGKVKGMYPIKAEGKDCTAWDKEVRNKEGAQISYIRIAKSTDLQSAEAWQVNDGNTELSKDYEKYIKWFDASYILRAGDCDQDAQLSFPGNALGLTAAEWQRWKVLNQKSKTSGLTDAEQTELENILKKREDSDRNQSGKTVRYWRIWNCITPIGTGWRMQIPANANGHNQQPVDVAHHVETFSHSWNYSDNSKIEHTGSLRFRVNLGNPTSLRNATNPATTSSGIHQTDKSAFLLSLADKTFFLRIYAWWEGGYMDYQPEDGSLGGDKRMCPCRLPGGSRIKTTTTKVPLILGLMPTTLSGKNILQQTLEITNADGSFLYNDGTDYTVHNTGTGLEITRVIDGTIQLGQVVYATYSMASTEEEMWNNRVVFTGLAHGGEVTVEGTTRYMECQLFDYMKIMQDQYFINSPFFDGMNDYFAIKTIANMAGLSAVTTGSDPYPPLALLDQLSSKSAAPPGDEWIIPYPLTKENLHCALYALPSSYDLLQSPFMKYADGAKYDEALSKIANLAGKIAYFDRFGVLRYDVRADMRFLSNLARSTRRSKCNFVASPHAVRQCTNLDLLAFKAYTYKTGAESVVNDILLMTATPAGEVLVKSVTDLPGRYDPSTPGYVPYLKRLMQVDGIFGSQEALEKISKDYANKVFGPPTMMSWESMGVSHLQAMDIVKFTGLNDDLGFPAQNTEDGGDYYPTVTLILSSVSGEINPSKNEWMNRYDGEWLYGDLK